MKLSEMIPGTKRYVALASDVLAVLSIGVDGYRVYVGSVPGDLHSVEWPRVAESGAKQSEDMAKAIVAMMGFEVNMEYAR